MLHDDFGFIFELKYGIVEDKKNRNIKNADAALMQILSNKYIETFENVKYNPDKMKVKNYALVGLHYSLAVSYTHLTLPTIYSV